MAKLKSGGGLFFPWRSDDIRARGRAPQPRFLSISRSTFSIITGLLLAAGMSLGIKPEPARAQNTATYTITFEGNWNAQSTPPGAPGGAHFTTLIGAVHNNDETFWAAGSLATAGVENVAETGSTTRFNNELVAARGRNNVKTIIRFSVSGGGEATKTTTVEFSKDYPLFTILSMLGPSPDWFVGLSGFSLLDGNGNWYSSRTVDLFAYDAGTEEGTGWSLSNPASNPHVPISSLKGMGKFTNVRVARMTFERMTPMAVEVTLSADRGNIPETGGTKTITATLNRALVAGESLTVPLTFGGTAQRNTDYMLAGTTAAGVTYNNLNSGSANIVFGSGARTATLTLSARDDTIDEGTAETVTVGLGTPTPSGLGGEATSSGTASFSITDDDTGNDGSGRPDEPGPVFVATRFAFTLAENLVGPAPVRDAGGAPGAVRAAGAGVTYTLASGGDGLFRVDAATGAVHYVGPGEATGRYALTVQATDFRGRVAETQVTVEVRDAATVSRLNRVHRTVLPEAARLAAGSAFAAVSERLDATRTAARLQVAGYELRTATANLAETLATGAALPDLPRLLAGSEFVLPLSATGDDAGLAPVLWGAVDWTALSGGRVTDWDGGMLNAHLGADVRLSERLLGGLALSHARGTFDWTDQGGDPSVTGTYQSRMTSLMPYLGWTAHERLTGWAGATLGRGEVQLNDAAAGQYDSEATAWSAGAGARGTLLAAGQMVLALKGEAWVTQWEADGDGPLAALNAAAQRLRLALEGQQTWTLASGSVVVPELEVGVRHDGGDGETGTGVELGGGVRWSHPAQGLTMQVRARTLLGRGDYRQWGVAGLVRVDPGADGQGLALSVTPALGVATSGVARLWNEGVSRSPAAAAPRYEPRLEAALGYGFAAPGTSGTATPYAGFSLADTRAVTWRAGMRLAASAGLDAYMETTWREPTAGMPDHGVMLEVRRRF